MFEIAGKIFMTKVKNLITTLETTSSIMQHQTSSNLTIPPSNQRSDKKDETNNNKNVKNTCRKHQNKLERSHSEVTACI